MNLATTLLASTSVDLSTSGGLSVLAGVYGAFLGGIFASFYGVVSERVPRGETLGGRSHCRCGRQLVAHENLPIIGWLLSRGVARCCGAKLPASYVLFEVLGTIVVGLVGLLAGIWAVGAVVVAWGVITYGAAMAKRASRECEIRDAENSGEKGQDPRAEMTRKDS